MKNVSTAFVKAQKEFAPALKCAKQGVDNLSRLTKDDFNQHKAKLNKVIASI